MRPKSPTLSTWRGSRPGASAASPRHACQPRLSSYSEQELTRRGTWRGRSAMVSRRAADAPLTRRRRLGVRAARRARPKLVARARFRAGARTVDQRAASFHSSRWLDARRLLLIHNLRRGDMTAPCASAPRVHPDLRRYFGVSPRLWARAVWATVAAIKPSRNPSTVALTTDPAAQCHGPNDPGGDVNQRQRSAVRPFDPGCERPREYEADEARRERSDRRQPPALAPGDVEHAERHDRRR